MNTGNIFVIGATGVGKSPLAEEVAKLTNKEHLSASEWVKKTFVPSSTSLNRQQYVQEITEYSRQLLKKNRNACIDYIKTKYSDQYKNKKLIIDGIRNPLDFNALFDFNNDYLIFLSNPNKPIQNIFESGIETIIKQMDWCIFNGLFPVERVFPHNYQGDHYNMNNLLDFMKEYFNI